MATESVNDWVVKVGFDSSEVEKGAKRVEKIMARLAKMQAKVIKDSTIRLALDTSGADRSIKRVKSDLEKLSTEARFGIRSTESTRRPTGPAGVGVGAGVGAAIGFQLADDRQLKIANTIDSVMRRAARNLEKNSDEFKQLNRQAEKLKRNIAGVSSRTGLEKLNNQIRILRDQTTSATSASRRMKIQMDQQRFAANALRNSIRNLGGAYASVFLAIEAGKAFFRTGKEFDSINASLLAASGSVEQAGKDFEFIKETSLGLGIRLREVATGFAKIGAAGKASGLTDDTVKEAFVDISKTVRAFGLSQDRAGLVFLGFQQILSKGVVSMQELRQQIGEQLPTAIPIAKKALKEMGSSFTSLDEAVKSGTLSAKEFVPVFSRLLREDVEGSGALAASLKTITAAQDRFLSTIDLLTIAAFEAGGKKGFITFFDNLALAGENLKPLFRVLGKVVGGTVAALGLALRAVSILITPVHILIDAWTDLFNIMASPPEDGSFSFLGSIGKAIKALVGILLIPLAIIEETIMAIERLRDKFTFEGFGDILEFPQRFANEAGTGLLRSIDAATGSNFAGESTGAVTTNSGNNITVNIEGNGDEGVIDQIEDFFQDIFSTATPSN